MIIAKDSRGNLAQGPAGIGALSEPSNSRNAALAGESYVSELRLEDHSSPSSSVPRSLTLHESQNSDPSNLIYLRMTTLPGTTPHPRVGYAEHLFQVFYQL